MSEPIFTNLDPAYRRFLSELRAQVGEVLTWWVDAHPGELLAPETLTGLCGRRFPINRKGQTLLSLDEQLWASGRRHA